jgi:hypothetical protein
MKKLLFLSLILLILISGCKKSDLVPIDKNLIGKWTYAEYYYSIAGPGQWHPVEPANQTIEFKSGGSFISSESFLKTTTKFEMVDSATIKFQPASTSSGYILMGFSINTVRKELYMYPVSPMCIEGCNNKFKR